MVDALLVAVFYSIEKLQEDALEEPAVTTIEATLDHRVEEIATRAEVEDDIDVLRALEEAVDGHDVRMIFDGHVGGNLPLLEMPAAGFWWCLLEDLDCILLGLRARGGCCRCIVDGAVDDTVGAFTKHLDEAETTVVYGFADEVGGIAERYTGHGDRGEY